MTGGTHGPQDINFGTRVSEIERQQAVTDADVRGIYASIDEIREVLVRMQENQERMRETNRPNLGALFLALLASVTILVSLGSMALSPRDTAIEALKDQFKELSARQLSVTSNRFTDIDGKEMHNDLTRELDEHVSHTSDRMLRNEDKLFELYRELGRLEGVKK